MGWCLPQTRYGLLVGLGLVLAVAGVVLIFEFPVIIHKAVSKTLPLQNGSALYDSWVQPPVPISMQFWVWDLVNRDDFVENGAKPILRQKGPYTYRVDRHKTDIVFSEDGTKVSYRQPKTYQFQRHLSVGDESDNFTNVNFPMLSLVTMGRFMLPSWVQKFLRPLLQKMGERLYQEYSVKDYLWGYKEPLVKDINDFTRQWFNTTLIKNETFGLFAGSGKGNNTDDGMYVIDTGLGNLSNYYKVEEWKGHSSVPFWSNSYCNKINGTTGSAWHPFLKRNETLYLFPSDICRSVDITYMKDITLKGIPLYRYTLAETVMADNVSYPDNIGFCTPDCLKSGVLNISACSGGAPVVLSLPHFYLGDQEYIDAFDGLHPDPAEHTTLLDIEPTTGAALNVVKKIQLNFYVRPFEIIEDTKNLQNDLIFPVVWINESSQLTDDMAHSFRMEVTILLQIAHILPSVLVAVGGALVLLGGAFYLRLCLKKGDTHPENSETSTAPLLNSSEPQTNYHTTEPVVT